jgi:hypothetical protein
VVRLSPRFSIDPGPFEESRDMSEGPRLSKTSKQINCLEHGFAYAAQHLDRRVDRELRSLLVDDVGHTRARHHQDLRRVSLLELMLGDPVREFSHQLLRKRLGAPP